MAFWSSGGDWVPREGERKNFNKKRFQIPGNLRSWNKKIVYISPVKLEIKPKRLPTPPTNTWTIFTLFLLGEGFAFEEFNDQLLPLLSAMYDFVGHNLQVSFSPFVLSYIWVHGASFGNNIEVPYLNLIKSNKYNHNS